MKHRLAATLAVTLLVATGCDSGKKKPPKKAVTLPAKPGEKSDASPAVKQAREAYERREYEKVIALLEGGVTDKRATPEHFYFLAMAYMNVARLPECEDTLKRGADRFPGYHVIREGAAYYQYVIGRLRLEEGDLDAAHAAFGEALDQLKDDASFQAKVASGYRQGARRLTEQGKAKLAIQALEKARKRLPTEPTLTKALEEARAAAGGGAAPRADGAAPDEALKRIMAEPGSGAGAPAPAAPEAPADTTPIPPGNLPPDPQGGPSPAPDASPAPLASAPTGRAQGLVAALASPAPGAAPDPAAPPAERDAASASTLAEARAALDQRDPARAASLARLVLGSNPMDREGLLVLARAQDRLGKPKEALAPLSAYVGANPGDAKASLELARLKAAALDAPGAEALADSLLAAPTTEPPDRLAALHTKAIARLQAGNVKGAEESLGLALQQDPEYPPALFVRGQIEESRKKYKDAIGFFERAARPGTGDPDSPRYNFRLGLLYRQTGQDDAAARAFQRVLAEDPDGPWGRKARAFAADPAPQSAAPPATAPAAAPAAPAVATPPAPLAAASPAPGKKPAPKAPAPNLDALKAAAEANPDDTAAHLAYADGLEKAKRTADARVELEKAAELAPDREDIQLRVGTARFQTKDVAGATAAFRAALALNPKNPRTYFYLGDLLAMQKDAAGQKEIFQQLLAQNINEKTNTQARQMLRRLEGTPKPAGN